MLPAAPRSAPRDAGEAVSAELDAPTRRLRVVAVVVLAVVGGVVPLLVADRYGAIGIPRNDDWAWLRAAFELHESGRIDGQYWAGMNLVGQLVAAWPVLAVFGLRIDALQVETTVFGVVGLVALFDLACHLVPARRALFVAVMVPCAPMWMSLTVSFMTDIPAFALAMVCLALGARGIVPGRLRWTVWLGVAFGFGAFTVREYSIVAPVAVLAAAAWTNRRERAVVARVLVGTAVFLVAVGAFAAWHRHLPNWNSVPITFPDATTTERALHDASGDVLLIGLLTLPAVVLAGPLRIVRASFTRAPRTTVVAASLTAALLARQVVRLSGSLDFYGGNYVSPAGSLHGTLPGARPFLVPRAAAILLAIVAACSVVVVVCRVVVGVVGLVTRRRAAPAPPALVLVALAAAAYAVTWVASPAIGASSFDRYGLPLAPLVAVMVLRGAPTRSTAEHRRRSVLGVGALGLLALLGLLYGVDSASFDGTKWAVATRAARVADGPTDVAGGFEWNNWHDEAWHRTAEPEDACVVLRAESGAPASGRPPVAVGRVAGLTGTQVWIVARRASDC